MWRISWKDLLIYALLIILLGLAGCHPVFVSEDQMTAYSHPAGSSVETRPRPIVWIFFHNRFSVELRDASSIAQAVLDSCGFQIAGTAFADSGVRTSPPHQFRLDVSVQDRADVADQDERNREYHSVIVRARLVRAQDNIPVAEGQGAERYDADGRSRGFGQRAYPERQSAIRYAMERALSGMCEGRRSDYESVPYPYDAMYGGSTVCGYGASGRTTKKGAWDMRYDCRRY